MTVVVTELNIYPIKSCRGTSVERARVGARGLEFDRQWMLIRDDGMFLTQRQFPRMALIHPLVLDDANTSSGLRLSAPSMEQLVLDGDAAAGAGTQRMVEVWGEACRGIDQGDEAAQWFSRYLGTSCRLVQMDPQFKRPVDSSYAVSSQDQVGFADGYPLLLISQGSLADLNSRLTEPLLMNRFRPNIVVDGCAPFAEDSWDSIEIGSVHFALVKPCDRCTVTTVDQATGERGVEPLKTLATFRKVDQKVLFGQNLIHMSPGQIAVGDTVAVHQRQPVPAL